MTQLMDLKKRVLEEVNNIELKKLQKILEQIGLTFEQNIQLFRPQDIIKIRKHLANNKTKYNCQLMIQLLNMKVINYIEYMNKKNNNNDRTEVKQALKQYRKTLIEALPYLQKNKVIEINDTVLGENFKIDCVEGTQPRIAGEPCIAAYMNFLITNKGVIVPQFGNENDALAIEQLKEIFPDKEVVGVFSKEIIYGGGNIHCITQQQPL